MMGVSWKLGIHVRNRVLHVGTWTGDRRFNFGTTSCMLNWVGIAQVLFKKVRLCMVGVGRGSDIPFRNYFGMMDMGCGLDIWF